MPALRELLIEGMQDLLHAEGQLVRALPKMAKAAKEPKLRQAIERHTEETKGQAERLKQALEMLGAKTRPRPCKGMQGLIEEGQEKIAEGKQKEQAVADLDLVASAQKVEHYEISGYGTLRTVAEQLGEDRVAKLLAQTLAEEEKTDKLLTQLSPPLLEQAAQEPEGKEEEEQPARRSRSGRSGG
jgi:Mn-containing catalase